MNDTNDTNTQAWKDRFDEAREASAAAEPAAAQAEGAAPDADSGECGAQPRMPKPTFSTFVLSLASSALVQLGEVPDPSTGEQHEDIVLARHSIDILSMLQDKVKNGLDKEESDLLEGLLYELRMKFIIKK